MINLKYVISLFSYTRLKNTLLHYIVTSALNDKCIIRQFFSQFGLLLRHQLGLLTYCEYISYILLNTPDINLAYWRLFINLSTYGTSISTISC